MIRQKSTQIAVIPALAMAPSAVDGRPGRRLKIDRLFFFFTVENCRPCSSSDHARGGVASMVWDLLVARARVDRSIDERMAGIY